MLTRLGLEDEAHHAMHAKTSRLRAWVTERYAAQEIEWDRSVRDVLDGASEVLAPAVGVRIEVERATAWSDAGSDGTLPATLETVTRGSIPWSTP